MQRPILSILSSLVILVALAGVASAQDSMRVVTGTTITSGPDELIIETESGREAFVLDSEALHPAPIEAGTQVTVWFTEREDLYYATRLETGDHTATAEAGSMTVETRTYAPTTTEDSSTTAETNDDSTTTESEPATVAETRDDSTTAERNTTTIADTRDYSTTAGSTSASADSQYDTLPQTASRLPLVAILGLISLAGATLTSWLIR